MAADLCFVMGALLVVIRSYFLLDHSWDNSLILAWVVLIARIQWIISSVLYLVIVLILYFGWSWEPNSSASDTENMTFSSEARRGRC